MEKFTILYARYAGNAFGVAVPLGAYEARTYTRVREEFKKLNFLRSYAWDLAAIANQRGACPDVTGRE